MIAHELDHDVIPGSPEWQGYVTGSKIAGILAISPWDTPRTVWEQMTGRATPKETTPAMLRGTFAEEALRPRFRHDYGATCRKGRMWVSDDEPRFAYSPDGIARTRRRRWLWEAKAPSSGHPRGWGEPGTDEIPEHYRAQITWGMGLLGLDHTTLTVDMMRDGRVQTLHYEIPFDPEFFHREVMQARAFLEFVERDEPTPAEWEPTPESMDDRYPTVDPASTVEAPIPELTLDDVNRLRVIDDQQSALKKERGIIVDRLKDIVRDREVLTVNSVPVARWAQVKGRRSLDADALALAYSNASGLDEGVVREKFTKTGAPSRRFTLVKGGK